MPTTTRINLVCPLAFFSVTGVTIFQVQGFYFVRYSDMAIFAPTGGYIGAEICFDFDVEEYGRKWTKKWKKCPVGGPFSIVRSGER